MNDYEYIIQQCKAIIKECEKGIEGQYYDYVYVKEKIAKVSAHNNLIKETHE